MKFKRFFVLLLCLWLPLQVSAGNLTGCNLVKSALAYKIELNNPTADNHCDHMKNVDTKHQSHQPDCGYCKTHCSNSFFVIVNEPQASLKINPLFLTAHNPEYFSIYLDQPQRPPQHLS